MVYKYVRNKLQFVIVTYLRYCVLKRSCEMVQCIRMSKVKLFMIISLSKMRKIW